MLAVINYIRAERERRWESPGNRGCGRRIGEGDVSAEEGRVFDTNQSEPSRWMFPAEPSFFVDPRGKLELKDGEGIGGMRRDQK